MGLQSHKSPNFENLGGGPMARHREYYKGLPPSPGHGESCESMFAHGSSMHQKCSNHALTNLLFDLCKFVWIIDPLVIHPSPHLGAPTRPSTPKVLQAKKHAPTPYPSTIFTLESHLSLSRSLGVCHKNSITYPHNKIVLIYFTYLLPTSTYATCYLAYLMK
jgi:hypothetical protein